MQAWAQIDGIDPAWAPSWQKIGGFQPVVSHSKPTPDDPSSPEKALGQLTQASHALEPLHLLAANGAALITGGAMFYAGYIVAAAGCLDPTPVEPVTCAAGIFAGGVTISGGLTAVIGGVEILRTSTLPAMREDWGLP